MERGNAGRRALLASGPEPGALAGELGRFVEAARAALGPPVLQVGRACRKIYARTFFCALSRFLCYTPVCQVGRLPSASPSPGLA